MLKKNIVVFLHHAWHAGNLLVYILNTGIPLTRYNLTQKLFEVGQYIFCARLPKSVFTCICVYSRRAHGIIGHLYYLLWQQRCVLLTLILCVVIDDI